MDIRYATIDGGSIWEPNGTGGYSSLSIRDSLITNLGGRMIYLAYPVANCTFERNVFVKSCGFSIGIDVRQSAISVLIRNNVFYAPILSPFDTEDAVIVCWAAYGGRTIVVDANSFLNITRGYALKLLSSKAAASITAPNNYWGGLDTTAISALIYDKTDDLNSDGVITFQPIRQAADAATPSAPAVPAIVSQSPAQSVQENASVTLSVTATGNPAVSFQWRKEGVAISGATNSSLSFASAGLSNTGSYSVIVSNVAGTVTSSALVLIVSPNTTAPSITVQPTSQVVAAGSNVVLSVAATGVPGPSFQWVKNGAPIAGATSSTLLLSNVSSSSAGSYFVVVANSAGSVSSLAATITVNPSSALVNLSVRTAMATGQTLIVGAVVSGGAKTILVRAAGPALNQFGLSGMTDPRLELYTTGISPISANDDWPSTLSATFNSVGAFPFSAGSKDAALSQSLNGAFTVQAKGIGTGTVLVEAYDVTGGTTPRLVNVSARNSVGTGANILIAGFAISGTGTKQLLIRAVGPTLGAFGVTGVLADPKLEVFNANGVSIGTNDNWPATLAPVMAQVGAFALTPNSRDAALVVTLNAGASYTVQVSGADGGTGEALIEVYEVF